MNRAKVTEAEILDVLLGNADPALAQRIDRALQTDPQAAAHYAHWAEFVEGLSGEAETVRALGRRAGRQVMARLDEARAEEGFTAPDPLPREGFFDGLCRRLSEVCLERLSRRRLLVGVAAAGCVLLVVGVFVSLRQRRADTTLLAQQVRGSVQVLDHATAATIGPLEPGDRLEFPARLRVAPGASLQLSLPHDSTIVVSAPAELQLIGPRLVRQVARTVLYEARKRGGGLEDFTVLVPQGRIVDTGTIFEVEVTKKNSTIVQVRLGSVRLEPKTGPATQLKAGERSTMRSYAAVQDQPPPLTTDKMLAELRANFETKLLRKRPAPQAFKNETPPAGVSEVRYASNGLQLKAWLTDDPGDGQRRPAVVYVHGGWAFSLADWQDAQAYEKAGYILLAPTLRGGNGNPGFYESFYGEVDDVITAGQHLATLPYVDPDNVFVTGHSTGGTYAILAAMMPGPFKASVALAGMPDESSISFNGKPFDPDDPQEVFLRVPANFPHSILCPLHLIIGDIDFNLLPGSEDLARAAQAKGKSCELIKLPGNHRTILPQAVDKSIEIFDRTVLESKNNAP